MNKINYIIRTLIEFCVGAIITYSIVIHTGWRWFFIFGLIKMFMFFMFFDLPALKEMKKQGIEIIPENFNTSLTAFIFIIVYSFMAINWIFYLIHDIFNFIFGKAEYENLQSKE